MKSAVERHIELYRSMGFKYKMQTYMLRSFAAFAEGQSQQFIRTDTVLDGQPPRQRSANVMTAYWSSAVSHVR